MRHLHLIFNGYLDFLRSLDTNFAKKNDARCGDIYVFLKSDICFLTNPTKAENDDTLLGTFDTDDFPEIEAFVKKILAPFKNVCVENADGDLVYAAFGEDEDFFEGGNAYF